MRLVVLTSVGLKILPSSHVLPSSYLHSAGIMTSTLKSADPNLAVFISLTSVFCAIVFTGVFDSKSPPIEYYSTLNSKWNS